MKSTIPFVLTVLSNALVAPTTALGHGIPINVFVDTQNQLEIPFDFDHGKFSDFGGYIFSNLPAVGVSHPSNGLPDGSQLKVNITRGLLYWDGTAVVPTSSTLTVFAPLKDGFGNTNTSPISQYDVSANSDFQSGMVWGTYHTDPFFWETHSEFLLSRGSPPGIYGIALQFSSPGLVSSNPLLVPFVFGTNGQFNTDTGVSALETHLDSSNGHQWVSTLSSADWNSVSNWSPSGQPIANWEVELHNTTLHFQTAEVSNNSTVSSIHVIGDAAPMRLLIGDNVGLTVSNNVNLGRNSELFLNGGTLTTTLLTLAPASLISGEGTIVGDVNVNGGILSPAPINFFKSGGTATVQSPEPSSLQLLCVALLVLTKFSQHGRPQHVHSTND